MIPELFHSKLYGLKKTTTTTTSGQQHKQATTKDYNKQQWQTFKIEPKKVNKSMVVDVPWESVGRYLPQLKGDNVIEHINQLGRQFCLPYLKSIHKLLRLNLDELTSAMPKQWCYQPGWTRYALHGDGTPERVAQPLEEALVFDVEVSLEESNRNRPTLAVAVTPEAWYSWCSDTLVDNVVDTSPLSINDLIPMGRSDDLERLIVGHNVSFDRSYIREQYWPQLDRTRFLDTMSMHICISGLNQEQKMFAIRNGNPWNEVSALNNIGDVYRLYCTNKDDGKEEDKIDKDPRNTFVKGTMDDVRGNFQHLMSYCANDVRVTLQILQAIFPLFTQRFPNPITLAGQLEMSVMYLPVNQHTWQRYLHESQSIYREFKNEINQTLKEIACDSCSYQHRQAYRKDPWLWDLDWSTRPLTMKKSFDKVVMDKLKTEKKVNKNNLIDSLLKTSTHLRKVQPILPGYPRWFVECCDPAKRVSKLADLTFAELLGDDNLNGGGGGGTSQLNKISPKLRVMPKLLKLAWNGFPLHYDDTNGWGYIVPDPSQVLEVDEAELPLFFEQLRSLVSELEADRINNSRSDGIKDIVPGCLFYKLPHKDGPTKRVGNPLGKDFIHKVNDGTLRSSLGAMKEVVNQQHKISYWVNSSKRILSQMVLAYDPQGHGSILPRAVVAGTVTRRAVEPTWLTASNSYSDRLGSELKGIIQCPPGYVYVGADVDSQELWIASLLGDAHHSGVQGATGLGWQTLQGDKAQGTDMHSVTARSINISRDEAKVLNYARIYGSGPEFAARFLRQSDPSLCEAEAKAKAKKIFIETKGFRRRVEKVVDDAGDGDGEAAVVVVRQWEKGTESHMFNKLEEIATSEHPSTPILRCRISRALEPAAVGHDYITSRINWVVQSSAVDFLHILLVTMKWLLEEVYQIEGRFSISIHDEIRYIVRHEHRYRAAMALQLANLLTRSFFTAALRLDDLPASVAFFSSIEIDQCLRKDVHQDCKTPSNPLGLAKGYGVPAGESLNIAQLLDRLRHEDHDFVAKFRPNSA